MQIKPNIRAVATLKQGAARENVRVLQDIPGMTNFWLCSTPHGTPLVVHQSKLMPIENRPLRFRETSFARFAHIIGAALKEFPGAVKIDPSPLRVDSFHQPLRDAIAAKKKHGYSHPLVDEALFRKHADSLVVSVADSHIFIGSRESVMARKAVTLGAIKDGKSEEPEVLVDPLALEQVCLLLHRQVFSPQPPFVVVGVAQPILDDLESRYDVAFAPHERDATKFSLVGPIKLTQPK